jgi:hypothetical protein
MLGPEGMSGDETDHDASTRNVKKLSKLQLPWISEEVTSLLHNIDSYDAAILDECIAVTKRGNKPLPKSGSVKQAKQSKAAPKLPRNWYNADWYRSLSPAEKARLRVAKSYAIPYLVGTDLFVANVI